MRTRSSSRTTSSAAGASTPRPTADPIPGPTCVRTRGSSATSPPTSTSRRRRDRRCCYPVDPVTTLTPTVPFSPFTPTAVAGNGRATVSWQAPDSDGGAHDHRAMSSRPSSTACRDTPQSFDSTATTETVTGLVNGATYTFTVAAGNALGVGYPSLPTSPQVDRRADRAGSARDLARERRGPALVGRARARQRVSRVTGYVVTPFIGSAAQTPRVFHSTATSGTVTGLTNGRTYTFVVAATNANGTGARSEPSRQVWSSAARSRPPMSWRSPEPRAVSLSWHGPGPGQRRARHGLRRDAVHRLPGPEPITTFNSQRDPRRRSPGCAPGVIYSFKVAAQNLYGIGPRSLRSNHAKPDLSAGLAGCSRPGRPIPRLNRPRGSRVDEQGRWPRTGRVETRRECAAGDARGPGRDRRWRCPTRCWWSTPPPRSGGPTAPPSASSGSPSTRRSGRTASTSSTPTTSSSRCSPSRACRPRRSGRCSSCASAAPTAGASSR